MNPLPLFLIILTLPLLLGVVWISQWVAIFRLRHLAKKASLKTVNKR